jgi:Protein of unknown function (DUF559)
MTDQVLSSLASYFANEEDEEEVAIILAHSDLDVWEEPREELRVLDESWPEAYADTVAQIVVPPGAGGEVAEHFGLIRNLLAQSVYFDELLLTEADDGQDDDGDWDDVGESEPAGVWNPIEAAPVVGDWRGHGLRSETERRIAEALDRLERPILFFVDKKCRLGLTPESRENREPDFFVVCDGRHGILEVDGNLAHDRRAADDHARDRLFEHHGVRTWRFPAEQCYRDPDDVVAEFLHLLLRH